VADAATDPPRNDIRELPTCRPSTGIVKSTSHGASDIHDGTLAEQPYLARRQNWVNQLERHAFMLPGATALRFLVTPPPGADLRERVARVAPPVGMLPNFLTST
jgi:hypothetical protein